MAERTDISLIRMIADATIQTLSDPSPSLALWTRRIYRFGLTEVFPPHGMKVRDQLADLRREDPNLILARGLQVPPFMIFGAQWRNVVEQFDTEELPAALLQLYRHDLYPDPRIRTEAFQNATRALTELAPDLTARLSGSAIESIVANVPISDIAITSADGEDDYQNLTERWYEAARDSEQREALTLGMASNVTFPSLGGVGVGPEQDFYHRALADFDDNFGERAWARRAAVAATYLSIGISEEPREEADAAPERLDRESSYWLWITLGAPVSGGVGRDVRPIRPEALAGADEVVVALFADDGVLLSPDPPQVTFRSDGTGHFVPVIPGLSPGHLPAGDGRAWVGFQTPGQSGTWYVRCGVFVAGVLVHIETLTVAVGSSPDTCEHTTTFRTLSEAGENQFHLLQAPTLTVYANQSGSSIDLSFYVPDRTRPLIAQGRSEEIPTLERLKDVRSLLSRVSYGSPGAYTADQGSRYTWSQQDQRYTTANMSLDIRKLALNGHSTWEWFQGMLDKTPNERDAIRARMRQPGTVEMVLKRDARYVLPAQVFYDHPLDGAATEDQLTLCRESGRWLEQLNGELACLADGCPDYDDRRQVCLSGFWGFRHGVSTRISVKTDCRPWPITQLAQRDKLVLDHAISMESEIQKAWREHALILEKYADLRSVTIGPADGSVAWVRALGAGDPPADLLYFLAHMEFGHSGQFISFNREGGPKLDTSAITDANLQLCGSRPLLFLNGCDSAGQDPETLLALINSFLERGASGAVGTEITVFLNMATRFAEAFVEAFGRAPLGEAMRLARWDLLRKGSPLGLIYLAFGLVHLHTLGASATDQAPESPS
jgi:hypothetical protein